MSNLGDVARLEGLYRVMEGYDKVPILAEHISEDQEISDEQLIFRDNYMIIKDLINTGKKEDARKEIGTLVEVDSFFRVLDLSLQPLGTSFSAECLEQDRFLTPKQLNDVIFEKYAPESRGLSEIYTDKQGFAVVSNSALGHDVVLCYDKSVIQRIVDGNKKIGIVSPTISVPEKKFCHKGSIEETWEIINNLLAKEGIDDHHVILSKNSRLAPYLAARFSIKRVGGKIHNQTPIRDDIKVNYVL